MTPQPFRPTLLRREFMEKHPYRIDLKGGFSLRFASVAVASASALHYRRPIWDEKESREIVLGEARLWA